MSSVIIITKGLKELKAAIKRNPKMVIAHGRVFLNRSLMAYRRVIEGAPWKVGQSGGGAPWKTGHLSKGHTYRVAGTQGTVKFEENPQPGKARGPYGTFVHIGTRKMQPRPWLDFAMNKADGEVRNLHDIFLDRVVKDLAR